MVNASDGLFLTLHILAIGTLVAAAGYNKKETLEIIIPYAPLYYYPVTVLVPKLAVPVVETIPHPDEPETRGWIMTLMVTALLMFISTPFSNLFASLFGFPLDGSPTAFDMGSQTSTESPPIVPPAALITQITSTTNDVTTTETEPTTSAADITTSKADITTSKTDIS